MSVAIQDVVCAKRNDVTTGEHMVRAALHHSPDVEIIGIQKGGDCYAQQLLAPQFFLDRFGKEVLGELCGRSKRNDRKIL